MARRKNDFLDADKIKLLLWCDRHCCLCGKACGTDIEIAHIEAKEPALIDNAIPLCYDCHARIGHYNREHPRGTRYKGEELKARRNQIYEQYTRALVPPIGCQIESRPPLDPDLVGFTLTHHGDALPVQVRVVVTIFRGDQDFGSPVGGKLYNGRRLWNLNPRRTFSGHFDLPVGARTAPGTLEARVKITVFDQYERAHPRLSESWIYEPERKVWYPHPDSRL